MRRPICLVKLLYFCVLFKCVLAAERNHDRPVWGWACLNGKCTKTENNVEDESALSLEVCKMFCNDNGVLWPKPNGEVNLGMFLSKLNISDILIESKSGGKSDDLVKAATERFKNLVKFVIPEGVTPKTNGKSLIINLVNDRPDVRELSLDVEEQYSLRVAAASQDRVNATISAPTFFGLRHGLETLSQLIVYDDIRNHILMVRDVKINDKPVYPYRGILLDTARNYFPIDSIKRTIDNKEAEMRRPICLVKLLYFCVLFKCVLAAERNHDRPVWGWACLNGKCTKTENNVEDESALSLEVCKMFCNDNGVLWPKPNGEVNLGMFLSKLNISDILIESKSGGKSDDLVKAATERFKNLVKFVIPEGVTPKTNGKSLIINLVNDRPDVRELSLDVEEQYSLRVAAASQDRVNATISAPTFFGLRHGLETLSQLIVYDDIRNHILMVRDVKINDKPVYPYRGILLDTARNYFPIDSIKRTIDAMAAVKLNTFHWHITDSQSFPFVSERRSNVSKYGAYSPAKVYTKKVISEIVQYGLERGVRVLPEFDAPGHVGEGWQNTNLIVCFKAEPWRSYCAEPPCGQLDPSKSEVYDVLEDIYKDMADAFHPDLFHMGGDEVKEACWNTSASIQQFMLDNNWGLNQSSYLQLWNYFQENAKIRAYKAFGKKLPLILWTSTLTEFNHIQQFLNKDDYIIQVWTTGDDPQIMGLLEQGYRLIMSNYDALYFDCGFGAWVGTGGEAALWSEQADSASLDGRLWPRAAAFAERMWAEPTTTWQDAEERLLNVRERLVRMGIQSESIQPGWCYQNEGKCVL